MIRQVDIEKLVFWAYREELPKEEPLWGALIVADLSKLGFGPGYGSVAEYGRLLAKVDAPTNQWGVVADLGARSDPHPDAKRIALAVASLDHLELTLPDDWSPLADLGDLGELGLRAASDALERMTTVDREGVRRLRETPRRLVFKHAILGGCPDWRADPPTTAYVSDVRGRPRWFVKRMMAMDTASGGSVDVEIECEGFNETRGKPYPGAYRKTYLDPDPTNAAVARAEYEVWHAALGVLAADLEGELADFEPLPPGRVERPWECAPEPVGRVLRDLTPKTAPVPPKRPRRRASALAAAH